jgi:hypothetical protein
MHRRAIAALLFLLPWAAQASKLKPFYVPQQQYRFSKGDPRCSGGNLCTFEPGHGYGDHDFSLNFVEFRDNGTPFDKTQLPAALAQLRAARANSGKTIVFIYIHGWHNGADERPQGDSADCGEHLYDGDVAKFRNCGLKVIASNSPASSFGTPRVVGIYLAWHGTDFGWPPLSYVPSYPIRRYFARSVGLNGMAKALECIFSTIQESRDSYFVIAMGHSFGARALEAADEFVGDKPSDTGKKHPEAGIMMKVRKDIKSPAYDADKNYRLPVDLIFYVNAATSHYISRRTITEWGNRCREHPSTAGCDSRPLYLAVSSRADILTAIVMPIANVAFFWPPTDSYHIISAANTPWMQTHSIPRKVAAPEPLTEDAFCFTIPNPPGRQDLYEVKPKSGKKLEMFWDMDTDHWNASLLEVLHAIPGLRQLTIRHWVISSHGDVWNTGVFNMVRAVIETEQKRANGEEVTCGQPGDQKAVLTN